MESSGGVPKKVDEGTNINSFNKVKWLWTQQDEITIFGNKYHGQEVKYKQNGVDVLFNNKYKW